MIDRHIQRYLPARQSPLCIYYSQVDRGLSMPPKKIRTGNNSLLNDCLLVSVCLAISRAHFPRSRQLTAPR